MSRPLAASAGLAARGGARIGRWMRQRSPVLAEQGDFLAPLSVIGGVSLDHGADRCGDLCVGLAEHASACDQFGVTDDAVVVVVARSHEILADVAAVPGHLFVERGLLLGGNAAVR